MLKRILFILFILSATLSKSQTADSATWWINTSYISCLDSGKSVCHCQEQNPYLALYIDSGSIHNAALAYGSDSARYRILLMPSIYTSWEPLHASLQPGSGHTFSLVPSYGVDSNITLALQHNTLLLQDNKKQVVYTKEHAQLIPTALKTIFGST